MLETDSLKVLAAALERLDEGFAHLPDARSQADTAAIQRVLDEVASRLTDNFPYFAINERALGPSMYSSTR